MKELISGLEPKDWVTMGGILLTFIIGFLNLINGIKINKKTIFVNAITSERVKWMGQLKELLAEYLSLTTFYELKPTLQGDELKEFFERLIYLQNRIKLHLNYIDKKDRDLNDLIDKINKKIFGFYEVGKILELPSKERFKALPDDSKQKYFDKVFEQLGEDAAKKILVSGDYTELTSSLNKVVSEINKDMKVNFGYQGRDELIANTEELVSKAQQYLKEEWEKVKKEAQKGKLKKKSWFDRFIQWILNF